MGVENRQELVALQNTVDAQAKLITELMARIKALEAKQNVSAEKIAKMNKTVNVFNPELVLRNQVSKGARRHAQGHYQEARDPG